MIRKYGVFGSIKLFFDLIMTKIFFPQARLIRSPVDIRNRFALRIGKNFTCGRGCRIECFPIEKNNKKVLVVGSNVQINDYVHIASCKEVIIEDNVLIASKVFITDISHGIYSGDEPHSHPHESPEERILSSKPVLIKTNVWIGEFVSVLPGVVIGKGTIVGSNSVVSKSLPDHVIAVGSPARPIKAYNFQSKTWEKIV